MRVLLVAHDSLPAHPHGTEVYTHGVAQALRARGHEVHLFCAEKDVSRPHLSLRRREHEGVPVHELVNNLFYEGFRETWDWPPAEEAFERVLDLVRPDVVHVMHLLYLSVGCLERAARRGCPVFFTLHDFWLQCPRFGQLVHADGTICHEVDFARCGSCLARFKFAQTPGQRRAARAVAAVRRVSGLDLAPLARRAAALADRVARAAPLEPPLELERRREEEAGERAGEVLRRALGAVERFLAPSRFLRERFVAWGVPEERIEVLDYGIDLAPFEGFHREPAERVRVAFVGSLVPHKGPQLLLEAWGRLPASLRGRATLTLFGPKRHEPAFLQALERTAREVGATLPGELARDALAGALARTDLLCVPSTWYENQPLTILEARATGTPLLVSDLGGMAELVEEGVDGWRFPPGDVAALARALEGLLAEPERLARVGARPGAVKDVATAAAELEERYHAALERRGASREARA